MDGDVYRILRGRQHWLAAILLFNDPWAANPITVLGALRRVGWAQGDRSHAWGASRARSWSASSKILPDEWLGAAAPGEIQRQTRPPADGPHPCFPNPCFSQITRAIEGPIGMVCGLAAAACRLRAMACRLATAGGWTHRARWARLRSRQADRLNRRCVGLGDYPGRHLSPRMGAELH